jgi:hypothetical protein
MHADYTTVRDPKQPLLDLGLLRVVACKYARRQREPGPESAECAGDGAGRFEYYSCVVRSVFLFIPYNNLLHLVRDIDCIRVIIEARTSNTITCASCLERSLHPLPHSSPYTHPPLVERDYNE